jgi:hypothetical protein
MGLLNRDGLLAKEPLKVKKVLLSGDDYVCVRQMTGRERDQFEQSLLIEIVSKTGDVSYKRALSDFRAKLAVRTVCDDDGILLLKPEDFDKLSENISAARLELIINTAQELNRITDVDKEALIKNSVPDRNADTISGPVGNSDLPTPISGSTS